MGCPLSQRRDGERYAWFDGGTWQATVVEAGRPGSRLAILPSGRPALAYVKRRLTSCAIPSLMAVVEHDILAASDLDSPVLAVLPDGTPVWCTWSRSHQLVYACRDASWQHTLWNAGVRRPSLMVLPWGAGPRTAAAGTSHYGWKKGFGRPATWR
jgi:hypothetical protein